MATCINCHGRISPSDSVVDTVDGPSHRDCWLDNPEAETKRGEVCPECFTEKSLTGVCAC